jgi:hypothetical protein
LKALVDTGLDVANKLTGLVRKLKCTGSRDAILLQPDSVPHAAAFANEALTGSTRNFI